jgi:transposase-like protein
VTGLLTDCPDRAADAERRLRALVNKLDGKYPSAAAFLAEDLSALTVRRNLPLHLRKRLRSSNLLERSLKEVRRRTKGSVTSPVSNAAQ